MMLWYKYWCESRARFLLSAAAFLAICAAIVLLHGEVRGEGATPMSFVSYVWNAVYKDYLRNLFALMVIVLAGGTLLQERSTGTIGLTLSLPVSRRRLVMTRTVVGLAEVVLLALVPAISIPLLARIAGQHYPLDQSLRFALLWSLGGTVIFSGAVLCASLVANEYASWASSFVVLMLYEGILNLAPVPRTRWLDVLRIESGAGMPYFDGTQHVLIGSVPMAATFGMMTVALSLLAAAIRVASRRDY